MRILILYPFLVRDGCLGGVARVHRLIGYLDGRGHEVRLACFTEPGRSPDEAALASTRARCREMVVVPAARRPRVSTALRVAFGTDPRYVLHFRSEEMRREVRRMAADARVELLHVEFTYLAGYVAEADAGTCATVLVDEELNFVARRREFEAAPVSVPGLAALWEARKFRRQEIEGARRFDKVLAITEEERAAFLAAAPDLDVGVYPNCVDAERFAPAPGISTEPGALLFVGNFEHRPNVDAAAWFVREVLPRVRSTAPDARLDLVGAYMPPEIRRLQDGCSVRVLGYVDDVRPHLARSAAFVSPVVSGGGMRGKVLEALAMGCPVVSTSLGAQGIAARHERELLVADTAEEFAEAVARLLGDAPLRAALGARGRELVLRRYDDRQVFPRLEALYEDLVREKRAAGERPREAGGTA